MRDELDLKFRAAAGAIAIVLLVGVAVVAVQIGTGYYDGGFPVTATFDRSTQGLYPDSDVKIRGINVGSVESIKLSDEGRAVVTMRIHDDAKVPDTAVASIEPLSVFGPKFIRLEPGDHERSGPFLREGDTIDRTEAPIEFTEVLANTTRLLSGVDAQEVVTIIKTLADGLSGLGPELAATVDNAAVLSDLAARHSADTEQFLADVGAIATALADHGDELVAAADDLHKVLPEINSRPDEFDRLLDSVAGVASDVADILVNPALEPALSGLSEVIGVLHAQSQNIPALLDTLNLFFGGLGAIIREPGPDGTLAGALRGRLDARGLCDVIVGPGCPSAASLQRVSSSSATEQLVRLVAPAGGAR